MMVSGTLGDIMPHAASTSDSSAGVKRRRVALITGAAGAFGRAFALNLSRQGFDLVLTDRNEVTPAIALHPDCTAIDWPCELCDSDAIMALCQRAIERFGQVDVLINNAADQMLTPFAELTLEAFRRMASVNLEAPLLLARALIPGMSDAGWGRIISIASRTPWQPSPGFAAYISSKMGLIGLMRALAHEYGEAGITANAVCPGLTEHDGNRGLLSPELHARARGRQAIKRAPTPEDVAGVVAFLASEASGFVTGQTISADGGSLIL